MHLVCCRYCTVGFNKSENEKTSLGREEMRKPIYRIADDVPRVSHTLVKTEMKREDDLLYCRGHGEELNEEVEQNNRSGALYHG